MVCVRDRDGMVDVIAFFLGRSVEQDWQDTSGVLSDKVRYRVAPAVDSKCQAHETAPLARKPSISSPRRNSSDGS